MIRTARGLTLVEMLVVLALLAVLSGMVVGLTDNMDQRERYNDTAKRLTEVRAAILGPDAISADGALLSGGYLQDVGTLPTGGDLIRCPSSVQTFMASHFAGKEPYQYDATWHTWYGWRGPYVNRPPLRKGETDATSVLYDGWGNDFIAWSKNAGNDFVVQSQGAHGATGGTGVFDKKYPDDSQPLIRATEWQTPDLSGHLQITVVNLTQQQLSGWNAVRFRVVVPDFSSSAGPLGFTSVADPCFSKTTLDLSALGAPNVDPLNPNPSPNRQTFTFVSNASEFRVPMGHHTLLVVDGATGNPMTTVNGINVSAFVEIPFSKKLSTTSAILYVQVAQ